MKKIVMILLSMSLVISGCGKSGENITPDKATEIALSHAGIKKEDAKALKAEKDRDDGKKVYDIEFYSEDGTEYDYEIDADTGEIISYDTDVPRNAPSSDKSQPTGETKNETTDNGKTM